MKKEYDFSKGVRGKFHKASAKFNLPVYLDNEIQDFIGRIAAEKKTNISAIANRFLRKDMELIEAAK